MSVKGKPGRGRFDVQSIRKLLDHVPDDGCMLLFNASHRNVRSKAMGILTINKISPNVIGRDDKVLCDLYVAFKED